MPRALAAKHDVVAGLFQLFSQWGPDASVNLCIFILIWTLTALGALALVAVLWWALNCG